MAGKLVANGQIKLADLAGYAEREGLRCVGGDPWTGRLFYVRADTTLSADEIQAALRLWRSDGGLREQMTNPPPRGQHPNPGYTWDPDAGEREAETPA
jgi:hypothetical protein